MRDIPRNFSTGARRCALLHSDAPRPWPSDTAGRSAIQLDARGMTFGTKWRYDSGDTDHRRLASSARPQRLAAGAGLAGVALVCAWTICANLGGRAVHQAVWEQPDPQAPGTSGA